MTAVDTGTDGERTTGAPQRLRVLLVDDHTLVRAAIRALVSELPDVSEVMEAADGRVAIAIATAGRPDVILMDIGMAGLNGLEAVNRIVSDWPSARIVVLSMHHNQEYVCQALRYGALGYVVKQAAPAELELAIRTVARGDIYLSPAIAPHAARVGDSERTPLERLTPRQREVLQLIAEGHTSREIAETLQIRVKTVESHRTLLMKELGIHDLAGLVRYAVRVGLVPPDDG